MRDQTWVIFGVALAVVLAGVATYVVFDHSSPQPKTVTTALPTCPSSTAAQSAAANLTEGNWTTYHKDPARSGDEPSLTVYSAYSKWSSAARLDGQVYAEPLVCGGTVYVATENNSVYALNATNGELLWTTHLGSPVNGSTLPCGDIDPSGITGTPVIDAATQTLYAVAFLNPTHHTLFGLDLANGTVTSQVGVDPSGALPQLEQQRGALALDDGTVYIPYGGLAGDCGAYHGWVVGVPLQRPTSLLSYQVPTGREGGIWATAGITVAPDGNLFVATGNSAATTTFDYGNSVIELSPQLQVVSYFAPTDWAQLNSGDVDLGSVAPTVLPNGDVFQIGKAGVGYLLSGNALGGIGGQLFSSNVCGGAYGGTAQENGSVLIPCSNGVFDLSVGSTSFSPVWHTRSFDAGPPIVTSNIVWAVDISSAELLGFDLANGTQVFSFPLGSVDHFITPVAAPGAVFVAGGDQLFAFALD
jgi:outer membrane protein assembly factor BamB